MKNQKGLTIIEIVVSFVLISIIVFFLFQIIFVMKELYFSYGIKTEMYTKQTIISDKIYSDFKEKTVTYLYDCSNATINCINIIFDDGTSKELSFDTANNSINYGTYKTSLLSGSEFGEVKISTTTLPDQIDNQYDSLLVIDAPIYHSLITKKDSTTELENFGLNIVYQYNSRNTYIGEINVIPDNSEYATLLFADNVTVYKETITDNIVHEPGYYIYTENNDLTYVDSDNEYISDPYKVIRVSTCTINSTSCTITYTLKIKQADNSYTEINEYERNVSIVEASKTFALTNSVVPYSVLVDGIYELQVWGAEGGLGPNEDIGGKGGYTKATIELTTDDSVYVTVGSKGDNATSLSTSAIGGYNGGGSNINSTSIVGGAGGGATDIRIGGNATSNRVIVAGGGGGAGYNHASGTIRSGGAGGGSIGLSGDCTITGTGGSCAIGYDGVGATSSAGGTGGTYNGITTNSGSSSIGGSNTTTAVTQGGAGGGGYFGGGAGLFYGTGGGGSGYCNTAAAITCDTYDGTMSFYNPSGFIETGHSGNGYAKIILKQLVNEHTVGN